MDVGERYNDDFQAGDVRLIQGPVAEVYDYLDEWAGGSFTVDDASRLADAPNYQIHELMDGWPPANGLLDRSRSLDVLQRGDIRPTVAGWRGAEDMLSTALRLLLYVDEVVVESDVIDPFMDLREEIEIDRPAIRDALTRLALIRPLVLVGAIRFAGRWRSLYGGRAVGYSMAMGEVPESEWGTATEDEFLKVRHELPYLLASSLLLVEEEKATPLARSRAEQVALEALFNDHQIDGRLSLLNTLARFPVPNFGGDPAILVNLRSRSDAFADWRVHLGNALSVITDLPESPRAIAEAQGVLSSELTRQLAKVKAEVEGSSALRAVSDGVKRLGFAGIGTATGAVVANTMGPSIVGPLAAAATAHSAHTISDYLRERQSRGAAKAIWDVALTFTDS